ncbi:hypothetical protein LUZ63_004096 [Rhynchospora breviuscula]|uniref:DUF4220 domain-containing protein n=1 Tax=Rhynchospora breviuscula TaxID=2022672 RepID=A0A9Q0D345_9POAL|nr:hypothetical protein LUZ63_004096 [Rhynchospora breviuscula]
MKIEHELAKPNEVLDPKYMKGYKYLVIGEGNINPKINNGPDYTPEIELPPGVVTLDEVWSCKDRLLDPSIDTDSRLREVCLSFAFFKLLKRRFYEYPAAEAQLEKTRQLVFNGLLSRNNDSIYRVIAMEIAFLRDFFYTRYPVAFALGVPVLHVILLVGMFGVSVWISVLAILCKGKFSRSLNNTIGQYSLLENYNKFHLGCWLLVTCIPYSTWGWSPSKVAPNGMKKRKAVVLSPYVKGAIVDSLRLMSHYPTKGVASLVQNGVYDDLAWSCTLKTEFHTLIVWHIATGLCEIQPVKDKGNKESVQPYDSVASHLSNYCAYLMVFLPDMLPESIFSVKLFFHNVLTETKEFFHGAHNYEDKYNFMLQVGDSGNRVIDMGARLAKYLMEIPDDARRWKIMANFWSEFIIFLAPSGKEREHLKNLESGGEFITHLWALLYHAGIVHDTATASSGHHP